MRLNDVYSFEVAVIVSTDNGGWQARLTPLSRGQHPDLFIAVETMTGLWQLTYANTTMNVTVQSANGLAFQLSRRNDPSAL